MRKSAHAAGMTARERQRFHALRADLEGSSGKGASGLSAQRKLLAFQEEVHARVSPGEARDTDIDQLDVTAAEAFLQLGGTNDLPIWSLKDYDAATFGPLLGVSDDGSNAPAIVDAFLSSPKATVLQERGSLSPLTLGACVDAERMSAAGELLVGPDEYADVRTAAVGRAAMTTNVGTVVLPRFYRAMPFVVVRGPRGRPTSDVVAEAIEELRKRFAGFVHAVGGSRRIAVFVAFRGADRIRRDRKLTILRAMSEAVASGDFCDPELHRIGLLQRADGRTSTAPAFAIRLAAEAGIGEVMIEGDARFESQDQVLLPGLLSYFGRKDADRILNVASSHGVTVRTKNQIDVATAARTIWAGLHTARSMGLHLGKFGLFPLTLEEQFMAMQLLGRWFPAWSPTPAFYVDRPIVTADGVRAERELVEVACEWVGVASQHGFQIVLVDSPDRTPAPAGSGRRSWDDDRGRRLLRRPRDAGAGVLDMDDLDRIAAHGRSCTPPVRVLWAGGLSGREAHALARR